MSYFYTPILRMNIGELNTKWRRKIFYIPVLYMNIDEVILKDKTQIIKEIENWAGKI